MNRLLKIIRTFKRDEINTIERYLSLSTRSGKKLLLFKLLRGKRKLTEEELSTLIFGKVSFVNLKKLEERLLQDVEDILFLKCNRFNSGTQYESKQSEVISQMLLAKYYLQNDLYIEAYKKLRKAKKLIVEHNFVVLEVIYCQLYCDYLNRIGASGLENEIKESICALTELQFIMSLKLKGIRCEFPILTVENEILPVINGEISHGEYTKIFMKLIQIKHLISIKKIERANIICNTLLTDVDNWIKKVPFEMYVDILLQRVKINIFNGLLVDNILLIENIKKLGISAGNNFYEYLKIRFLNFYALRYYDVCKSILFFFFSDKRVKGNISECITSCWVYFNMCLSFIDGQYENVLKMLAQFPNYTSYEENVCINVKMLEIYTLILMGNVELVFSKLRISRQFISGMNFHIQVRYERILDKIGSYLDDNQNSYHKREKAYFTNTESTEDRAPDYLDMELISFEMFEEAMKKESKKYQIVM